MKTVRIQLTPMGHFFFGGERGFGYDKDLKRQVSDRYYISSLKTPSQTTLFGTLRYLIGVKDEKLRPDSDSLIGKSSFNISDGNENFGVIKSISPLYLLNDKSGYYIRTPFDHDTSASVGNTYTQIKCPETDEAEVINFPSNCVTKKRYPDSYDAKKGISHSYMSVNDRSIVTEDEIFKPLVEVVSNKKKKDSDGFAKKEYYRLTKGWSFTFFADLDVEDVPEYNRSVVMGKDSSIFGVTMTVEEEPDVSAVFKDIDKDFKYCQSPVYISCNSGDVVDKCRFCILENENMRAFETRDNKLQPVKNSVLIQLICAGSVLYMPDICFLDNSHAAIAGFNRIINGGK